ncbi:right-handed parallel beta-helix repeat-containing protein [Ureibacillus chungkukjangi]|uniref:F-box protein 11 n=1 Tax=Ureibacillus chungkukjangi TaxID=1202712 RepID=A0A318TWJ0_9BACL|nr:right-handed parallel beta-helix repeat-containing protein [Ureibacillus chungkukjangi]MCM3388375.1 right-handed parallel beta-helix repeat-containing protein [Ureibacillus chungkukjangi]PYF07378.1 F-box protein 11 [Ureibacillus chungkukjangi]
MTIYRLFSRLFTKAKTIQKIIQHSKAGNFIQLKPKLYKESIHLDKNMVLAGDIHDETIIEGLIIIPKNVSVTLQNLTISPTAQMYIEGEAVLQNCHFKGGKNDIHVTVDGGKLNAYHCNFEHARDMALSIINNSKVIFENCNFDHNGKTQILAESSQVYIEKCEFSYAKHGLCIRNGSFVQSRNVHFHHHTSAQIVVEDSRFIDHESVIEHGDGMGIHIYHEGDASIQSTVLQYNTQTQICVQRALLTARYCSIQQGKDAGISITQNSEAQTFHCEIAQNKKSNVVVTKDSKMNIEFCKIHNGENIGIQICDNSIVNVFETMIKGHRSSQVTIANKSICSMKKCEVSGGYHVGICIEDNSNCSIVECEVTHNANSAITLFKSELSIFKSTLTQNVGNGILAMSESKVEVDMCKFYDNEMPHIACKSNVEIYIIQSKLFNGKSLFIVNECELTAIDCQFYDSLNVQIEICDLSNARFENCQIYNGKSYGVKVLRNSSLYLFDSQIFNHELSQMVVNDSSVILKNSELFDGNRNALYIQNHSEVFLTDCFISKHAQHQLWIDFESTVELKSVQVTDGTLSDIFAQNQSSVYVSDSVIRNNKSRFNVQAVNFSNIEISKTIVENIYGDVYYSENHSFIKQLDT